MKAFDYLGRVHSSGFGPVPLPFYEIRAGVPWADDDEVSIIREMSIEYLQGRKIGEDPFGKEPWRPND